MSFVGACCNTPPTGAHWHTKGEQKPLSQKIAGQERTTYRTGPKDSKRGIIAIYDIFGHQDTTYQFFDRIAESHGGFQLSAPHIFHNGAATLEMLGDIPKLMTWVGEQGDYKKNHIDEIIRVAVEDLRADGCTSFSIFGQCWGALIAVLAASEEGTPFLAAGGPHPSSFTVDLVKNIKTPLIALASKDEADLVNDTTRHRFLKAFPFFFPMGS